MFLRFTQTPKSSSPENLRAGEAGLFAIIINKAKSSPWRAQLEVAAGRPEGFEGEEGFGVYYYLFENTTCCGAMSTLACFRNNLWRGYLQRQII